MTAREITPFTVKEKTIANRVDSTDTDGARDIAPLLLFGSLDFHTQHPTGTDVRPRLAIVQPSGDESKEAGPPAEVDPKVHAGSSATSSAASSPDDTPESGKMQVPLGTHPSSLSESSVPPVDAEKELSEELLPPL